MSEGTDWDEVFWNLQSFQKQVSRMYGELLQMDEDSLEREEREFQLSSMAGGFANSFTLDAVVKLLSDDGFRANLQMNDTRLQNALQSHELLRQRCISLETKVAARDAIIKLLEKQVPEDDGPDYDGEGGFPIR